MRAAKFLDALRDRVAAAQDIQALPQRHDSRAIPVIVWTSTDLSAAERAKLRVAARAITGKYQYHQPDPLMEFPKLLPVPRTPHAWSLETAARAT